MTITLLGITLNESGTSVVQANFEIKYSTHIRGLAVLNNIRQILFEEIIPPIEKKLKEPAQKHHNSRSDNPNWLTKEVNVIRDCKNAGDAWEAYKLAFPGERNRNAIDQKLRKIRKAEDKAKPPAPSPVISALQKIKKLEPTASKTAKAAILAKNAKAEKWSEAEKDLLRTHPVFADAWKEYQRIFPDSKRNRSTVQQRWNIFHPKKARGGKLQKSTENVVSPKVEKEDPISILEKPQTDTKIESDEDIVIQGAEGLVDEMPEEPTASRLEIRTGVRVKQVGGTKIMAGIGTVKRCPNGKVEVLVAFDNGMEWMERKNLVLVTV